jgi:hypothetical protein
LSDFIIPYFIAPYFIALSKQVAGSSEGGNQMLIPTNTVVSFFAICETFSQEELGSRAVKLQLLCCGQPSHLS